MGIFNIAYCKSLEKYLGCPIFQGRRWKTTFHDIINEVKARLVGWKANSLSKAGRKILIESHLESILTHMMQCVSLLKSTSDHLDKIRGTSSGNNME